MIKIASLKYRLYSDYFLPNRLEEYRSFLQFALASNYMIASVIDYYDLKQNNQLPIDKKIIICRHDIDTDSNTARDFLKIEKELGVKASYYFRLSTLSPEIMTEIEEYGSEASYHYEEIATYCKMHRIKDPKSVYQEIEKIQSHFIENYCLIKTQFSLKMRTVCSHGDFVNRYLKIANTELLTSDVREKCGIECEAYDQVIKEGSISISDSHAPTFWREESIFSAIKRGENIINFLTHPRHWRVSHWENTKDNFHRIIEDLLYHYS
jgi:hypothetical protein